jgi:protein-tyrosine-phosphatase
MADRSYNVLFLCTGNSARSILAESLLNHWGRGRFRGFSAGSHPKNEVHPIALELLKQLHFPIEGLRSKAWDEFAVPGATPLDFSFTVCDNAAGELCPVWPGKPVTAHWGVPDPAAVQCSPVDKWTAFRAVFHALETRIKIFVSLPIGALDRLKLKDQLDAIGKRRRTAGNRTVLSCALSASSTLRSSDCVLTSGASGSPTQPAFAVLMNSNRWRNATRRSDSRVLAS